MKMKDVLGKFRESAAMKKRADKELYRVVLDVNNYYHLMHNIESEVMRATYRELYLNAKKEFEIKAKMYDAIFLTKTVLVYAKENGEMKNVAYLTNGGLFYDKEYEEKVVEITFESRPA